MLPTLCGHCALASSSTVLESSNPASWCYAIYGSVLCLIVVSLLVQEFPMERKDFTVSGAIY